MSVTYTKLFSSITESTVWCEPMPTRLVWITMLAMADRSGRVWGSVPGLANRARVSVEECEAAVAVFLAPDKYSRTKEREGRRIEEIDGGWRLINHAKYRDMRDEEATRESKRDYMRRIRSEGNDVEQRGTKNSTCGTKNSTVDPSRGRGKEADSNTVNGTTNLGKTCAHSNARACAHERTHARGEAEYEISEPLPPPGEDIAEISTDAPADRPAAHPQAIRAPAAPAKPPPCDLPDSERWRYVRSEPWARAIVAAGGKIGPQNWPAWRALADAHRAEDLTRAIKSVAPAERWPDKTEAALNAGAGDGQQADWLAAIERKTSRVASTGESTRGKT